MSFENIELKSKNIIDEKKLIELVEKYENLKDYKSALFYLKQLYEINPNDRYYFSIITNQFKLAETKEEMLKLLGKIDQFLMKLDDDFQYKYGVYCNRGIILLHLGLYSLAKRDFEKVLSINPDFYIAEKALGILNLLIGNFEEGWKQFQARWYGEENLYGVIPKWNLEAPLNSRVFIYNEQGIGDNINFFRYVFLLKEKGLDIIVKNDDGISELLDYNLKLHNIKSINSGNILIEYQASLMDLPYIFSTNSENVKFTGKYLENIPEKLEKWGKKINNNKKIKIGFFCKSYSKSTNSESRNISLEKFSKLFSLDVEFHFLQKEIEENDKKILGKYKNVYIWQNEIENFSDTSAIIEQMDLIITVDTAVAHLGGALAKETWVLLPYYPDFRWLLDREDSIWYDSVKLFRQKEINDWDYPLDEIYKKLSEKI